MNNEFFWNQKFNRALVGNRMSLEEIEKKFKIKIFIFGDIGSGKIEQYIKQNYDLYIIIHSEASNTKNVLKIFEKYQDRVLILGNVIDYNTALSPQNKNFFYSWDWLQSPVYREHNLHNLKLKIRRYDFDCLIGRTDGNRDYFYKILLDKGILDRSLYSYQGNNNVDRFDVETENLISNCNISSTEIIDNVCAKNKIDLSYLFADDISPITLKAISRVTPKEIYKQSFASIVRETCFGDYETAFFATEKTAKPLWAGRLFFPIANQNFCKTLESLNLQLYHDYSYYDSESNFEKRVEKFTDYIASLTSNDLIDMYNANRDKIDYNFRIVSKNWTQKSYNFVINHLRSL